MPCQIDLILLHKGANDRFIVSIAVDDFPLKAIILIITATTGYCIIIFQIEMQNGNTL